MGLYEHNGLSEYEGKPRRSDRPSISEYAKSRPRDEKGRFIDDKQSMEEYYQWDRTKWVLVKDADHVMYERRTYLFTDDQKVGIVFTCAFILLAIIL